MNKPKHFLIAKIIGIIGFIVAIGGIVLAVIGFGDSPFQFMIGGMLASFGLFFGITCTILGFRPQIAKYSIKTAKYIQQSNKEDLKDILDTQVEISKDSIGTVTETIKQNLEDDTIFCKHCGDKIDSDSKFCKTCGKEQ